MATNTAFMLLGPLSIILTWAGLVYLIRRWPGDLSMSFSLHAAQTRAGQVYYFWLFIITLPLFYLFLAEWYVPALHLPGSFLLIVTVGIVGQIVAVLVPAVGGAKDVIHNLGAYLMATTLLPLTGLIAFAPVPTLTRAIATISVGYMVLVWALFIGVPKTRSKYLYFQASYVAMFHVTILLSLLTYKQST